MLRVLEKVVFGIGYVGALAVMLAICLTLVTVLVNVVGLPMWAAVLCLLAVTLVLHYFLSRKRDAPELKMRDSVWNDPDDA